eukprot:765797-Hanusia_phi.AAC.1
MRAVLALLAILSSTVDARKCGTCWLTSLQCTAPTGTPNPFIATSSCNFGYSDGTFSNEDPDNGLEPITYQAALYTGCGKASTDPVSCKNTSDSMSSNVLFGGSASGALTYAATIPYVTKESGVRVYSLAAVDNTIQLVEVAFPQLSTKTNKLSPWKGVSVSNMMSSSPSVSGVQGGSLSTWCTMLGGSGSWAFESRVEIDYQASVVYRYALGKINPIATYSMPDKKTVFLANSNYLYMFVADHAKDLRSGSLYVAQMSGKDVKWLNMGNTNETAVKAEMKKNVAALKDYMTGNAIKAGMDGLASRMFPDDYAKMKGATSLGGTVSSMTYNMDDKGATGKESALNAFFISFTDSVASTAFGGSGQKCSFFRFTVGSITNCDLAGAACNAADQKSAKSFTSLALKAAEPDFVSADTCNIIPKTSYINFASYHNMLFVADGSKVWAINYNGNGQSAVPVVVFEADGSIASITWLSNLVGDGRSYLSINVGSSKSGGGYIGYLGPFTLKGYIAGSYDMLHNIGCPIRGKNDYLYDATNSVLLVLIALRDLHGAMRNYPDVMKPMGEESRPWEVSCREKVETFEGKDVKVDRVAIKME